MSERFTRRGQKVLSCSRDPHQPPPLTPSYPLLCSGDSKQASYRRGRGFEDNFLKGAPAAGEEIAASGCISLGMGGRRLIFFKVGGGNGALAASAACELSPRSRVGLREFSRVWLRVKIIHRICWDFFFFHVRCSLGCCLIVWSGFILLRCSAAGLSSMVEKR